MKKELKDKHFIKKPIYPGGVKAMQIFLTKEKKYPKEALKNKIEGTVHVRYTIGHQGKVIRTKIIAGLGHGCDQEAERIVKLLEFKVPRSRNARVQYHKTVHIHFKLPKQVVKTTKIVYTQSKGTQEEKESKESSKGKGYHYQIKW